MKPLILNTYDDQGGAAIATYRMHCGLRSIGVNSQMLVQSKGTDDSSVIASRGRVKKVISMLRPHLEKISLTKYPDRKGVIFSPAGIPERIANEVAQIDPDILHMFWVNNGFLKIETIKKLNKPLVWTLHDMWPFTGGCHYDDGCEKFMQSCGACPVLKSDQDNDLSRKVWMRKDKAWKDVPMVVVATSRWLADMARASSLFCDKRIEVIPNGIDTEKYKKADKNAARAIYNLPQDKHIIMFSAFGATSDKRKGNHLLSQALEKMCAAGFHENTELIIVGASRPENPPDFGMKVHYIGHLHDEVSQILLYSAADVLVAPSMQENLSNTVMESLACSTPVVAFNIGGMPDMIDHHMSGYLASPFNVNDLAAGIIWVLDKQRNMTLGQHARQTVLERYTLEHVAKRYLELYQALLK